MKLCWERRAMLTCVHGRRAGMHVQPHNLQLIHKTNACTAEAPIKVDGSGSITREGLKGSLQCIALPLQRPPSMINARHYKMAAVASCFILPEEPSRARDSGLKPEVSATHSPLRPHLNTSGVNICRLSCSQRALKVHVTETTESSNLWRLVKANVTKTTVRRPKTATTTGRGHSQQLEWGRHRLDLHRYQKQ